MANSQRVSRYFPRENVFNGRCRIAPASDACRAFRFSSRLRPGTLFRVVNYCVQLFFCSVKAHISHLSVSEVVVIKDCAQARSIKEVPPVAPVRTRSPSIVADLNKMTVSYRRRRLINLMMSARKVRFCLSFRFAVVVSVGFERRH